MMINLEWLTRTLDIEIPSEIRKFVESVGMVDAAMIFKVKYSYLNSWFNGRTSASYRQLIGFYKKIVEYKQLHGEKL